MCVFGFLLEPSTNTIPVLLYVVRVNVRSSTEFHRVLNGPRSSRVLHYLLHWHTNAEHTHGVRVHLKGGMGGGREGGGEGRGGDGGRVIV